GRAKRGGRRAKWTTFGAVRMISEHDPSACLRISTKSESRCSKHKMSAVRCWAALSGAAAGAAGWLVHEPTRTFIRLRRARKYLAGDLSQRLGLRKRSTARWQTAGV